MIRCFDLHDKRTAVRISTEENPELINLSEDELGSFFDSKDIRKITVGQFRRLSIMCE